MEVVVGGLSDLGFGILSFGPSGPASFPPPRGPMRLPWFPSCSLAGSWVQRLFPEAPTFCLSHPA
eukprot:2246053-Pyramimonas_sp.AAC.1